MNYLECQWSRDYGSKTYLLPEGFMLDVVKNNVECIYEAWLFHKNIGIKSYVIGIPFYELNTEFPVKEFLEIVLFDIEEDLDFYREDYMS